MPSDIISFGFEDGFDGFEEEATFRGLSDTTGAVREDFFSEAVVGAVTGVGTGTVTEVFRAVGIAGILEIAGVIVEAAEIGAASDAGSSCARHSKVVS